MYHTKINESLYLVMKDIPKPPRAPKAFTDEIVKLYLAPEMLSHPVSIQENSVITYTLEKDETGYFVAFLLPTTGPRGVFYLVNSVTRVDPLSKPVALIKSNAELHTVAVTEWMIKGAYAMAYALLQQKRLEDTLYMLSALGDVALIDAVVAASTREDVQDVTEAIGGAARTSDEYSSVAFHILQCIALPSRRHTKGRDTNYLASL